MDKQIKKLFCKFLLRLSGAMIVAIYAYPFMRVGVILRALDDTIRQIADTIMEKN
tara:strand:- start:109 stop:273 length:165 start_codon:yes stop_codon:yes gene_type:complete